MWPGDAGDPALARDPLDAFVVDPLATVTQLDGDLRTVVRATMLGVDLGDLPGQLVALGGPFGRAGRGEPFVEHRATDIEHSARPGDAVGGAVFGDEPVAVEQASSTASLRNCSGTSTNVTPGQLPQTSVWDQGVRFTGATSVGDSQ